MDWKQERMPWHFLLFLSYKVTILLRKTPIVTLLTPHENDSKAISKLIYEFDSSCVLCKVPQNPTWIMKLTKIHFLVYVSCFGQYSNVLEKWISKYRKIQNGLQIISKCIWECPMFWYSFASNSMHVYLVFDSTYVAYRHIYLHINDRFGASLSPTVPYPKGNEFLASNTASSTPRMCVFCCMQTTNLTHTKYIEYRRVVLKKREKQFSTAF